MSNHLKIWWEERKAKHYLKNHWHLFADITFLLIILFLIVRLIIVSWLPEQKIDTTPVPHIPKITATTTTITAEPLIVESEIAETNIYSGKSFSLHLSLKNTGSQDITGLKLTPTFSNSGFALGKIQNNNASSSVIIKNNSLLVEKIPAGEVIEADISFVINAKADSAREISWFLKTTYNDGKDHNNSYKLSSLKLITDLKIKSAAYYNSALGDQLGSGPIPPTVGLPTNYWIFFEINNKGNDLSNVTVSAKLPEAVTLSNKKTLSAGEFSYDESQRRITWTVKKATTGNNNYQLGFEVQLLPTEKQIGLKPLLVSNISYLATDAYTGEKLSGKLTYIDTDLPLDAINQGQGKVIK